MTKSSTLTGGYSVPILKRGKNACEATSYKHIILMSAWTKLVSLIALQRTEKTLDEGIDRSQHAYMKENSATDIILIHKILIALNLEKRLRFYFGQH